MAKHNIIRDRNNAFDILRLTGAYIVLFSHSFRYFEIAKPAWSLFFTEGSVGVIMFFAMTGYVIMPTYERAAQKENPLLTFYCNRILKIFPPIFISFLVITVVNALIMHENVFSIQYVIYAVKYCVFARGGGVWS